jgi:hypothetical protein
MTKEELIKEIMKLKPIAKKAGFDFEYEHLTPAKMKPLSYMLIEEAYNTLIEVNMRYKLGNDTYEYYMNDGSLHGKKGEIKNGNHNTI